MERATVRAIDVYAGSNGDLTKRYYAELEKLGPVGIVAVNLFRAQKCSTRAKLYRGGDSNGRYRDQAYRRKNWSIENLSAILNQHADSLGIVYGWKEDPNQEFHSWVLYIQLPECGQVSFHSAVRLNGPTFLGVWDGVHRSEERILAYCDSVMKGAAAVAA